MKCRLCGALTALAIHADDAGAERLWQAVERNPPPAEIAELAKKISARSLFLLLERYGGTRIYIPEGAAQSTKLAVEFGLSTAEALAGWRGGEVVKLPVLRWWRVRIWRNAGGGYSEIAKHLGISEGTVWRLLKAQNMTHPDSPPRGLRAAELLDAAP